MVPSGVAAQAATAASSRPAVTAPASGSTSARISIPTARAVELDLAGLFKTQAASGAYAFSDAHGGFASYPCASSMSLDAYRTTRNTAALSQAAYSIGRYYTYLLASQDRDGDRLVESSAPWGGKDARVEDPGYNALLALDLRALARANLELRRSMVALHYYDAARFVARSVVAGTFDAEAFYFFPNDAGTNRAVRHWSPIAALPVTFDGVVGPNYAESIATRHVMRWATDFATQTPAPADATRRAMERLAGVAVLRATGHDAS
jgi:hypothetical protein